MLTSSTAPSGEVGLSIIRSQVEPFGKPHLSVAEVAYHGAPQDGLHPDVNDFRRRNLVNLQRRFWKIQMANRLGIPTLVGRLWGALLRADGRELNLGLMSQAVVTTAGVNYLVDAWQNLTEMENMKYHGVGTSSAAEAVGNTALGTELTTQYSTDNTRPTGSLTEGAAANVFRSVATVTVDVNNTALTEHGLFSQAATGGGTLWDRSVFGTVTLNSGDGVQFTYDCTIAAGS